MKPDIQSVMPWGRSLDEYRGMFALSEADLARRIVSLADGPASFNAEMAALGRAVVSVDPVYVHGATALRGRIEAVRDRIMENTRENQAAYRWDVIPNLDALLALRMSAMERFLAHYRRAERSRYICGALPDLAFPDGAFELALCSHFLFTYTEQLSENFHVEATIEMVRVAREVRIFPLLEMNGGPSPHVGAVMGALRGAGLVVERVRVPYEFQIGGNEMLVARRSV